MSCQNKADGKCCGNECASKKHDEAAPVRIDITRMEKALNSGSFDMPSGLSREEKRAFIISKAQEDPES